ncbi:uncharacterized protein FPRO_13676 [Fusarium proliferatum ET1]|uniref:Uncharacterized protein n=1 Tax=Fusarium proliferatum (strain ET1) TaxID=1227346 RepID=A0A1L7VTZ1_FUSPR|nr:uncharacterized protein FPRO_13676 [Fusarium proliferatum ET1]CZR43869.1 uncharacterized protein FPRO_13676 [Fusarium proliferatum ET1]
MSHDAQSMPGQTGRDEAVSYPQEALIQKIASTDYKVIVHLMLLAHLALVVTQAAAYSDENQISLMEYLQLFENIDCGRIERSSAGFQGDPRYGMAYGPGRPARTAAPFSLPAAADDLEKP